MFKKGDVLVLQDGGFIYKIIEVDEWEDNSFCYHILIKQFSNELGEIPDLSKSSANCQEGDENNQENNNQSPTTAQKEFYDNCKILLYHAPVANIDEGATFYFNELPSSEEKIGFLTYLEMTDKKRYLEEKFGKTIDEIIHEANELFKKGNSAMDDGDFSLAIVHFTEAFEMLPTFYECLDNKALILMDLNRFEEAIDLWEQSLQINDKNTLAIRKLIFCLKELECDEDRVTELETTLQNLEEE
ncbi:hypothetical protein ABK040_006465 [Willaertia magna]